MERVHSAEALARTAHHGQVDKSGKPYINHPERVAARCAPDELAIAVAWLHDVAEDTAVTLDDIQDACGLRVRQAVDAITRRTGEQPETYYQRVAADPIALKVKYADIADNTDPARTALLEPALADRLAAKYAHALALLDQFAHAPDQAKKCR